MSGDVLTHIFEPFFTTKRQGEGTGLGMSMVYGLMDQMGGYVTVESQPRAGTTVRLFFPAMRASQPTPASIAAVPSRQDSGTECILLVEDDHDIRALTARVLRRAGYEVTEAVSGEDAEQQLRARVANGSPPFALVVSDMVMPHGDGMYVLEATRRLAAPARIVWVSGYAGDGLFGMPDRHFGQNGRGMSGDPVHSHGVAPIIQKPWTTTEFLSRIRAVLDAPPNVPLDASATHVPFRAG
jgi:two-component system cell cycle sensor histidine kinase/response regulator CckA